MNQISDSDENSRKIRKAEEGVRGEVKDPARADVFLVPFALFKCKREHEEEVLAQLTAKASRGREPRSHPTSFPPSSAVVSLGRLP